MQNPNQNTQSYNSTKSLESQSYSESSFDSISLIEKNMLKQALHQATDTNIQDSFKTWAKCQNPLAYNQYKNTIGQNHENSETSNLENEIFGNDTNFEHTTHSNFIDNEPYRSQDLTNSPYRSFPDFNYTKISVETSGDDIPSTTNFYMAEDDFSWKKCPESPMRDLYMKIDENFEKNNMQGFIELNYSQKDTFEAEDACHKKIDSINCDFYEFANVDEQICCNSPLDLVRLYMQKSDRKNSGNSLSTEASASEVFNRNQQMQPGRRTMDSPNYFSIDTPDFGLNSPSNFSSPIRL